MVYYPLMRKKDNTHIRNPSSRRFAYGSLVCSFLFKTTTDAAKIIFNIVHTCPNFLHLHIPLLQVLPPETLFLL